MAAYPNRCLRALALLITLAAVPLACGGDGDGGGCGELARRICDAACDCPSSGCKVRYSSGSTQTFTRPQCPTAFTNSCNDGMISEATCDGAFAGAVCMGTGDDAALDLPAECSP